LRWCPPTRQRADRPAHYPADQSFQNGPTSGKTSSFRWTPSSRKDRVGQGWRMLMDCLAADARFHCPARHGSCDVCARLAGAYARVRRQFGMAIGRFEGV